ncbi:MAG TPA: nuclear transport factor 2 family protein [Blastocatellia bacterium]|nr:nuclear transport factor 2 family protein [Blastocatellia bacterium]
MKSNKLLRAMIAMATVMLIFQLAQAQGKKPAAKSATDAEFKALIDDYYAAWSSLNPDNAAKYYAKEADLVFYDIAPMKYNGWSEYKEGVMKAFINNFSTGKLTPNNDLKVTRRGNIAWTTVTFHLSATAKAGGANMELDARHTAIWEKRAGKWVIVHEHISAPLPG